MCENLDTAERCVSRGRKEPWNPSAAVFVSRCLRTSFRLFVKERIAPNFVPRIANSLAPGEMIHYSLIICEHLRKIIFKALRR